MISLIQLVILIIDIKWVCRVTYNTHTRTHAHTDTDTHTHTHTELSDKDNEEIEARGLKIVFEQMFYEDSFKRGSKISSSQSLYLLI